MALPVKSLCKPFKNLLGVRYRPGLKGVSERLKRLAGRSAAIPEDGWSMLLKRGVMCFCLIEIAGLQGPTQVVQRQQRLCAGVILCQRPAAGRNVLGCHD